MNRRALSPAVVVVLLIALWGFAGLLDQPLESQQALPTCTGDLVKQLPPYPDSYDVFDDTACELDADDLLRLVTVSRCGDPASVLSFLLRRMKLQDYGPLVGATLKVCANASGEIAVEAMA